MNRVYQGCGTTIFEEMSRLADAHGAVNLGQGFPVGMEPRALIDAAIGAMREGPHQYAPMMGVPALRQAVAAANERFFGIETDWETEVLVTCGACEALADCFLALLNEGDEVIVFEPAYDAYDIAIRRAGGIPVPVRLEGPHWALPRERLEAAITPKTRIILVNSPTNPIGKVFDEDEVAFLAGLLDRHGLLAVCDEVYDHIVFDGRRHIPLMTFPEARDRCLRIGAASKTFSLTGWRVGYVTAAPSLLRAVALAHQYQTFTLPPFLQQAVAAGLALPDDYFTGLAAGLQSRRDLLRDGFAAIGIRSLACQGTYFLCTPTASFGSAEDDVALCRRLTVEAGVAAIPVSSFYLGDGPKDLIRFCFAKEPATLNEAVARLGAWKARQG